MTSLFSFLLLWAQVAGGGAPAAAEMDPEAAMMMPSPEEQAAAAAEAAAATEAIRSLQPWQQWILSLGLPGGTLMAWYGPIVSWLKIVSVLCLVGWTGAWVLTALKDRPPPRLKVGGASLLDLTAVLAILIGIGMIFVRVAQINGRLPALNVGGQPVANLVGLLSVAVAFLWLEVVLWSGIIRAKQRLDLLVLFGIHLALIGSIAIAFSLPPILTRGITGGFQGPGAAILLGAQLGLTFMGLVAFLRIVQLVLGEMFAMRARRLYAMGQFSWVESFRKTRIPWAVLAVFAVILAFTHWFLQPPDAQRQAELSRLYVGTLMLLCTILITAMVAILTPISIPNDIRFQTIFTIFSKPVRRLEVVWGRMLGFMAVVTVLVVLFGAFSLIYLDRNVGGRITMLQNEIQQARNDGLLLKVDQLEGQLDQLQTRMSARVPVEGSLTFVDSVGEPQIQGIDVGQELEIRSFVEGATPAKAIWEFGATLPHPVDRVLPLPGGQTRRPPISRPLRLDLLLEPGTIEYLGNQIYELNDQKAYLESQRLGGSAQDMSRINRDINQIDQRIAQVTEERESKIQQVNDLLAKARASEQGGDEEQAAALIEEAARFNSKPVDVQMTFTVYRTTKGRVGDPVFASIRVINPYVPEAAYSDTFPIKEYYTNKWQFPARFLEGSRGYLTLEVQCLSPTQYLGMAESDLFIVADEGLFWVNYVKGLAGIWLQAMVLTAIGVWAGTFLSWPVALLLTVFFFISGEVLFPILRDLSFEAMVGGGPFESMIRMVTHQNQMTDLDPTATVILAKSFDAIAVPIMSLLVYIIPNFSALDVSNTVADGFAVSGGMLWSNFLLALAYAVPFSITGYFILKNREVAA